MGEALTKAALVRWMRGPRGWKHNAAHQFARDFFDHFEIPAPPPAWQPIETAPRDGQHVLLAMTDKADSPPWIGEGYYEEDDARGWFASNTHWTDTYDGSLYPTHWQPLPSPPDTASSPQSGEAKS